MRGPDPEGAAAILAARAPRRPRVAIVLGSGLGWLEAEVEDAVAVDYADLPGFPAPGVQGHSGRFVLGRLEGVDVLVQSGRYHAYEGRTRSVVAAPVRTAAALGVEALILTNAAGAVTTVLAPGDVMLVEDHIDLMFRSTLFGPVEGKEARFPDMSSPYDAGLASLADLAATAEGVRLHRGVYAAVQGPSYETAAEVRMLRGLGADVVGMSTVPEVLVARALGLRCLAISMVTNLGTGLAPEPLSHAEVVEVGRTAGRAVGSILRGVVSRWGSVQSGGVK